MAWVDDRGRFLGRVNALDLAVGLVAAVVLLAAARHAVLLPPRTEVHALVDLRDLAPAVAQAFRAGAASADGSEVVTDAVAVPAAGGLQRVLAKVRLEVERLEIGVRHGQEWLSAGGSATLHVGDTRAVGVVLAFDDAPGLSFHAAGEARVLVAPLVPSAAAAAVEAGQVYQLSQVLLVRVEEVLVVPRSAEHSVLYVRGAPWSLDMAAGTVPGDGLALLLPGSSVPASWHPTGGAEAAPHAEQLPVRLAVQRSATGQPPVAAGVVASEGGAVLSEVRGAVAVKRSGACPPGPSLAPEGPDLDWVDASILVARVGSAVEFHGGPLVVGSAVPLPVPGAAGATLLAVHPESMGRASALVLLRMEAVPDEVAERVQSGAQELGTDGAPHLVVEQVERTHGAGQQDLRLLARLLADPGPSFKGRAVAAGACFPVVLGGTVLGATVAAVLEGSP